MALSDILESKSPAKKPGGMAALFDRDEPDPGTDSTEAKSSPEDAAFRSDSEHCAVCEYFEDGQPWSCQKVEVDGTADPELSVCGNHFEAKEPEQEEPAAKPSMGFPPKKPAPKTVIAIGIGKPGKKV